MAWNADVSGYLASALVFAAFSMKSMRYLRMTAIASNIAFLTYAFGMNLLPIFILHSVLLPLNLFRLVQLEWPLTFDRGGPLTDRSGIADKKSDLNSPSPKTDDIARRSVWQNRGWGRAIADLMTR